MHEENDGGTNDRFEEVPMILKSQTQKGSSPQNMFFHR